MPRYLTGLISADYWRFPQFPYAGRQWSLDLKETEQSKDIRSSGRHSDGTDQMCIGREVVIDAPTDLAARRAFAILQNASALLDSADNRQIFGYELELRKEHSLKKYHSRNRRAEAGPDVLSHANIPVQCLVAIKAASKLQYVYALAKLCLSYRLVSIAPIDLDPNHSRNIGKTPYEEFHVTFAYAIIAAYAAIEEMEFEVRANNKAPSTIDGTWNPPVLADLEKRLRKAGVDLGEDFHWSVRGGKTRLEKARPPKIIRKSPWSGWQVRDGRVKVVDAIAHVSWLRSRVSAHRLKPELVRVLSVYDVINAQHLARRLLLERLNLWRIWDEYYP